MAACEANETQVSPVRLVVVGQGYVGLPLSVRAIQVGHVVIGYELDEARHKMLSLGESYISDISNEVLSACLRTGRYIPTGDPSDLRDFDFAVVTVPTPLREGAPELAYVEQAARDLGRHVKSGCTVVLESTTYPGTTEEIFVPILEAQSGLRAGRDFNVGYSPERIDPGNKVWRFDNTPKIVSGIGPQSLSAVKSFYESLVQPTVPVSSVAVAELAKLIENTYRHVNIALVNELAVFAAELGIDIKEAIDAAATKPYGYMAFVPGPGVGGHCLPIDPSYLSWRVRRQLGRSFRFVELANDINEHMPEYVTKRIMLALNSRFRSAVSGCRVLVLGLAYKKNTGDMRESPAAHTAEHLVSLGAVVRAADPYVLEGHVKGVERVELSVQEVEEADAVVILTDHDLFDYGMIVERAKYIFDARYVVTGPNVEHI